MGNLKEMGDFTWRESDCEELVGLLAEDGEGWSVVPVNSCPGFLSTPDSF